MILYSNTDKKSKDEKQKFHWKFHQNRYSHLVNSVNCDLLIFHQNIVSLVSRHCDQYHLTLKSYILPLMYAELLIFWLHVIQNRAKEWVKPETSSFQKNLVLLLLFLYDQHSLQIRRSDYFMSHFQPSFFSAISVIVHVC